MDLRVRDIPVNTRTIIAYTNLDLDIKCIFQTFPTDEYSESDTVIFETLYYGNEIRGKVPNKARKASFRNAINVIGVMKTIDKKINFKVSKNGKFQLTGCKEEEHAYRMVERFIYQLLRSCPPSAVRWKEEEKEEEKDIRISFRTVMTNIDFSIGFLINRLKLDELINQTRDMYSLLETSCGYTGVNIKFPLSPFPWKTFIPTMILNSDPTKQPFLKSISPRFHAEKCTNMQKQRYNTFLVFHSGNIIMSGMDIDSMEDHFNLFISLLREWRPFIEEKIIETPYTS